MKKAEEELHFVSLKVPTSLLQRINEKRAELQKQDPIKSWTRSEVMRLAMEKSLSADTRIVWPEVKPEDEEGTGEKGKAKGG